MPVLRVTHLNPPESVPMWKRFKGKTRCGRNLADVKWSEDVNDCSCNRCVQFYASDIRFGT